MINNLSHGQLLFRDEGDPRVGQSAERFAVA